MLNELRGPTHKNYVFNVMNTFRLRNLPRSGDFRADIPNRQLLMHGLSFDNVYSLLSEGFTRKASVSLFNLIKDHTLFQKKAVFGENFYFTNCSTKAANQTCESAWMREMQADQGSIQPSAGEFGYILFCEVAVGKKLMIGARRKRGTELCFKENDSLVFPGNYEPVRYFK
jgi:hypothetical protein